HHDHEIRHNKRYIFLTILLALLRNFDSLFPHALLCAGQCSSSEFWNSDLDVCVPCASCKLYPKTPSCNTLSDPMGSLLKACHGLHSLVFLWKRDRTKEQLVQPQTEETSGPF
uniref:TNFR-Cys domain-containing protein n=1 Tax=Mola mola TaxID=94237 RepID=A0A3Q4AFQ3_MOLML